MEVAVVAKEQNPAQALAQTMELVHAIIEQCLAIHRRADGSVEVSDMRNLRLLGTHCPRLYFLQFTPSLRYAKTKVVTFRGKAKYFPRHASKHQDDFQDLSRVLFGWLVTTTCECVFCVCFVPLVVHFRCDLCIFA